MYVHRIYVCMSIRYTHVLPHMNAQIYIQMYGIVCMCVYVCMFLWVYVSDVRGTMDVETLHDWHVCVSISYVYSEICILFYSNIIDIIKI